MKLTLLLLTVLVAISSRQAHGGPSYVTRLLDNSGLSSFDTVGIANDGSVYGSGRTSAGTSSLPLRWDTGGSFRLLPLPAGAHGGAVLGTSRAGDTAGIVYGEDHSQDRPASWHDDGVRLIGTSPGGAIGISGAVAVGQSNTPAGIFPTIWHEGEIQSVNVGPFGRLVQVNGHGTAVGRYIADTGQEHALLWSETDLKMVAPGSGYTWIEFVGIDDGGRILGNRGNAGSAQKHGFILEGTHYNALPMPEAFASSTASSFNARGEIVGHLLGEGERATPALWPTANSSPIDLNSLLEPDTHWHITTVADINDRGQILATALVNGSSVGVVLSPVPVPLPAGIWMTLITIPVLVSRVQSRRTASRQGSR